MAFVVGAAAGVLVFDALSSKGQQQEITNTLHARMAINSVTSSTTTCNSTVDSSQGIDIEGDGAYPSTTAAEEYCVQSLQTIVEERTKLDVKARENGHGIQKASPLYEAMMLTGSTPPDDDSYAGVTGPCDMMKSRVVVNVSQDQNINVKQTCSVDNSFKTDVQQKLSGQYSSYIKNQEDAMGAFEDALTSNSQKIVTDLSVNMTQNIDNDFTQGLYSHLHSVQKVKFPATSASFIVSNVSQSFNADMVDSLVVTNTTLDQLRQSAHYSVAQSEVYKNDTTGDLIRSLTGVLDTFSDLIETTLGSLILLIGMVIGIAIILFAMHYVLSPGFRTEVRKKMLKYDSKVTARVRQTGAQGAGTAPSA